MKKLTIAFGSLALAFAIADVVHGQNNGDVHRYYIHIAEFFFFLCLVEIQAIRLMAAKVGQDRWLAGASISLASFLVGTSLALMGGSAHGDGGPLVFVLALIGIIGLLGMPISLISFIVSAARRKFHDSTV